MRGMWWLVLPLLAQQADWSRVQTVYLLPMGNGLDQYLAGHLTRLGLFQVVADPKKADAVFTDRLGEAFEQRMRELYPPPPPPKPEKAEAAEPPAEAAESKTETARQSGGAPPSSWGRGRGTIFLVDAHSRQVLWSVYQRPRDSSPDELNRTAERIAQRLKRDWKRK